MPEKDGTENSMNKCRNRSDGRHLRRNFSRSILLAALVFPVVEFVACSGKDRAEAGPTVTVGVTKVVRKSLGRQLTLSSELVPFQEIDVYAKESGFVSKLNVD